MKQSISWFSSIIVLLIVAVSDVTLSQDVAESFCALPLPPPFNAFWLNPLIKVFANKVTFQFNIRNLLDCKARAGDMEKKKALALGRQVVFITHGYMNNQFFTWLYDIKDAIMKQEDSTVIVVTWPQGSMSLAYQISAANTQLVAAVIAGLADGIRNTRTFSGNSNEPYMQCIGHSLGAHACGQAGRKTKLHRILGMDPAGPGFESCWSSMSLGTDCADCVDAIHTDGSQEGHANPYFPHLGSLRSDWAHVNFYPNAGKNQPGCIPATNDAACSHMKAIDFTLYSIKNKAACAAKGPCGDPNAGDIVPDSCQKTTNQTMGYFSSCHRSNIIKNHNQPRPGRFYLKTAGTGNFC